jgi:hypothetical protein
VSDAEIQRTLRVATPKIVERLTLIAQGRDVWHSGTTGKGVSKPATLKEQLRAAELVLAKVIGDKTTVESTSTNTNLVVEPSVEQAESIRRALLDDLMMKARTDASGEGGIEAGRGENESPDVDARAESRFLTSSSDNVPSDPSIVSVTDPKQIAEFDRRIAAAPAADPNERHFSNGWSWRKTWDHGMGHYHWDVYAPGGVHASIRRIEERATRLCEAEGDVTA